MSENPEAQPPRPRDYGDDLSRATASLNEMADNLHDALSRVDEAAHHMVETAEAINNILSYHLNWLSALAEEDEGKMEPLPPSSPTSTPEEDMALYFRSATDDFYPPPF